MIIKLGMYPSEAIRYINTCIHTAKSCQQGRTDRSYVYTYMYLQLHHYIETVGRYTYARSVPHVSNPPSLLSNTVPTQMYSNKLPGYSSYIACRGTWKADLLWLCYKMYTASMTRFGGTFLWPTLSKAHKLIEFAQAKSGGRATMHYVVTLRLINVSSTCVFKP